MATSRRFAALLAERTALAGAGEQFVELAVSLRVCAVEKGATARRRWRVDTGDVAEDEQEILRLGGRWDRVKREWTDDPVAKVAVLRITRGGAQEKAARWLATWFRAHIAGDWSAFPRAIWSVLLMGGRRSGKSHLACIALVLYAIAYPGAVVWAISPTQEETAELEKALRKMMPSRWYTHRGTGAGKVSTFTLPHGATIMLLSGFKASGLRRGRADLVLLNEGQNISHGAYVQVRAAVADTHGLVLIAANPPDKPQGRWVEEHYEGIVAGKIDGVEFGFNPEENPWVEIDALHSMAAEVDEITYDRDVLGLLRPIGNVVFPQYSDRETRRAVPAHFLDVTLEMTREVLGRALPWLVLMDFQATPHMVGLVCKFFVDPDDATRDPLLWVLAEVTPENATEDDLVAALEEADRWAPSGYEDGAGYRGDECAVVMDASGFWQDGPHTRGKTSDLALRAKGWRWLFKPQKDSDKNPDIMERVKSGRARLKTKDGRRHLFIAPTCSSTATAVKSWENRNGVPYRRSTFAHVCDALTYGTYRFFGRPKKPKGPAPTYDRVPLPRRDELRGL